MNKIIEEKEKEFDDLILKIDSLKSKDWDNSVKKIWINKIADFVSNNYGKEYAENFKGLMLVNSYSYNKEVNQANYVKRIDRSIEYLRELKELDSDNDVDIKEEVEAGLETMHYKIISNCSDLFFKGLYSEAVEKSFKIVRDRLRELTGYETGSEAFGKGNLYVKGAAAPNVEGDFNEGVKFLTMAIDRFRNEKAHTSNAKIEDLIKACEYLALSSLALRLLDQAEIRK